jgi:hypothetical protein
MPSASSIVLKVSASSERQSPARKQSLSPMKVRVEARKLSGWISRGLKLTRALMRSAESTSEV